MQTLAHLSDLHFGKTTPRLIAAVQAYLKELQPELVVISGDLTQRARRTEFRQAQAFLNELPGEKLVVPGNHDVPLWNVPARIFWPLKNYCRLISSDLSPLYHRGALAVLGLNTARSWTWKSGRINPAQAKFAQEQLGKFDPEIFKIVVTHHPFDLSECYDKSHLVGRAQMAMEKLAQAGADVLLAGHFHESYTGGTANRYQIPGHSALVVQAGTATSTRIRRHSNSFNVLRIAPPRVEVDILTYHPFMDRFVPIETKAYQRQPETGFVRLKN